MASGCYTRGILQTLNGGIDLDTTTLKLMLVDAGYAYDPDHAVVDNGANNGTDPSFNEVVATGYTGGFNGAGRKTVTVTVVEDTANNRVVVRLADTTWTALGGATNDTVAAAILIREVTDDTQSILIAYLDFTDFTTNGSDVTLDFDGTAGNIRFTV